MKKLLILLAVVFFFALVFTACGEEEAKPNPSETPTNAPTEAPTEHVHTEEVIPAKEATCTEKGLTEGKKCSSCGEIIVAQTEIPAKGHVETVIPGKPATCTESGIQDGIKCSVCQTVIKPADTVIPALGHDWNPVYSSDDTHHWQECTHEGCTEVENKAEHILVNCVCTCGYGCPHTVTDWVINKNASCSEEGLESLFCYRCSATVDTRPIDKLPHTPGPEATCKNSQVCTVCNEELSPIKDHDWVNESCTKPMVCSVCNKKGDQPYSTHDLIPATCTEKKHCSRCAFEVGNPLGHENDGTGKCVRCLIVHGSQDWMIDVDSDSIYTPEFTAENSTWYYKYTAGASLSVSIKAVSSATSLVITHNGQTVTDASFDVKSGDEVVIAVSKTDGSTSNAHFTVGSRKQIDIVETSNGNSYIVSTNQSTASYVTSNGESYLKFISSGTSDPFFAFAIQDYQKNVLNANNNDLLSASDFAYILVKVKAPDCSSGMLNMYAFIGSVTSAPYLIQGSEFVPGIDEWHYVIFDIRDLTGVLHTLRFDLDGTSTAGCTVLISSIIAFGSYTDALEFAGVEVTVPEKPPLTPEEEEEKKEMLSGSANHEGYNNYVPETAANEDNEINLWFNHTYTRTPQSTVSPGNMFSYKLTLARNETEGCQLILSSSVQKNGLRIELSDFVHKNGIDTMESELLMGYYFSVDEDGDGREEMIIDPLPPTQGNFASFNLNNTSQTFVVKAKSKADTAAGEYSATITVRDADGNEVKRVTVFAYVWNIVLPESSSCKTLADLDYTSLFTIGASRYNAQFGSNFFDSSVYYKMADSSSGYVPVYKAYYDFLLENRVCAYTIPGIQDDGNYSGLAMEYMQNPRVVAFLQLGWKTALNSTNIQNSYNSLNGKTDSAGVSLLDKGYFYPVDEPGSQAKLDEIKADATAIKAVYGNNYNLIAPIHITGNIATSDGVDDFFSYVADAVTAWCPKTFFYNTFGEVINNPEATQGTSIYAESHFGLFKDRMEAEQKGGDEAWWYVTRKPHLPEITVLTNQNAVNYRILFWQQKLYNVDGFLYYSVNDWTIGSDPRMDPNDNQAEEKPKAAETGGWYAKHEIKRSIGMNVYGNGVLVYPGHMVDWDYINPVGSLRLECIRDGIEDYEYFTMLEELIGKDKVDMIINEITTSLIDYESDAELFTALREAVGALLEKELAN